MALNSNQAVLNAAVDTLMAAWETYIETLSGGEQLLLVPCEGSKGDANNSHWGSDATAVFNGNGVRHILKVTESTSDPGDIPLQAGKHPLFWKITNAAGDLS